MLVTVLVCVFGIVFLGCLFWEVVCSLGGLKSLAQEVEHDDNPDLF